MTEFPRDETTAGIWLVYDGECPICSYVAHALQIRRTVGNLHLVNARESPEHPVLSKVNELGFDLDEGMVLKYRETYYHGEDALHMMSLLGSSQGWFNKINAVLFRSKTLARLCYPAMRAGRNTLLRLKGVRKIRNLEVNRKEPLFKSVFDEHWDTLPPALKRHYAVRPFSKDVVKVEGHLNVTVSRLVRIISKLTGTLLAQSGKNIPVTIVFRSGESGAFHFDRTFCFPGTGDVSFSSHADLMRGMNVVEFVRFGIGWRSAYEWDGSKICLQHRGYVWRVFGITIPLPLGILLGRVQAEEIPLSDEKFSMWMQVTHPLLGKTFGYDGEFRITHVSSELV